MTQEPNIDAAKDRLRNAFAQSVRYDSDGLGEHLVRTRIVQTYAFLGGDINDLNEIRERKSDECTFD